jgi:hypothetical protein
VVVCWLISTDNTAVEKVSDRMRFGSVVLMPQGAVLRETPDSDLLLLH